MDIGTVGTILYWCEGRKRENDRGLEFVNSDPRMISVFMQYLRTKDIEEARIRARMMIHVQDDEAKCKGHCKKVSSLSDSNFHFDRREGPEFFEETPTYGAIAIRYHSLKLLRQINGEISALPEMISQSSRT